MIPPYPGSVARARDRVQALQAYFQQPSNSPAVRTPVISATRRSNNHRGLAQVGPAASSSDQAGGFYFYPSGSSGRNFQEAENPVSNRYHAWEREHLPTFPLNQVDRDPIWGPFHHSGVGSDSGSRSGSFRPRHGSERMSSQNRSWISCAVLMRTVITMNESNLCMFWENDLQWLESCQFGRFKLFRGHEMMPFWWPWVVWWDCGVLLFLCCGVINNIRMLWQSSSCWFASFICCAWLHRFLSD